MGAATESFLARIGVASGWDCVDVGCGNGTVTLVLARIASPDGRVVGLDLDGEALGLARAEAFDGELEIEFVEGDCNEPVARDSFDLAYARLVLSHLPDPDRALAAMRDSVRPGGVVAVEDLRSDTLEAEPAVEALIRLREVYMRTIRAQGEDPMIGTRLTTIFELGGLQQIEENVVVNRMTTTREKRFLVELITNMRESMIAAGAATGAELDEIADGVERAAEDPGTVFHQAHVHQVSGRRPLT